MPISKNTFSKEDFLYDYIQGEIKLTIFRVPYLETKEEKEVYKEFLFFYFATKVYIAVDMRQQIIIIIFLMRGENNRHFKNIGKFPRRIIACALILFSEEIIRATQQKQERRTRKNYIYIYEFFFSFY